MAHCRANIQSSNTTPVLTPRPAADGSYPRTRTCTRAHLPARRLERRDEDVGKKTTRRFCLAAAPWMILSLCPEKAIERSGQAMWLAVHSQRVQDTVTECLYA
jgi:hypothetical protein